jgi:hypothetical protein
MDRWLFSNANEGEVDVAAAARDVGLDLEALKKCYVDPLTFKTANAEYQASRNAHVIDTPTYRIDGKKLNEEDVIARIKATK